MPYIDDEYDYYQDDELVENVSSTLEEIEETEEELSDLSEVEVRLEEANYLKALLRQPLFDNPNSEIAKRVEKRVRGFIQQELKRLMGIDPEVAVAPLAKIETPFTKEQERVLLALADRILNKEKTDTPVQKPVVMPAVAPPLPPVAKAKVEPIKVNAPAKRGRKKRIVEQEVTIGGKTSKVRMDVTGQTKPPPGVHGYPAMNQDQMNAAIQNQALTGSGPGIIINGRMIPMGNDIPLLVKDEEE